MEDKAMSSCTVRTDDNGGLYICCLKIQGVGLIGNVSIGRIDSVIIKAAKKFLKSGCNMCKVSCNIFDKGYHEKYLVKKDDWVCVNKVKIDSDKSAWDALVILKMKSFTQISEANKQVETANDYTAFVI